MAKAAKKSRREPAVGMKAIATEEEIHELEKLFTAGLKLQLETALRKNPYFKGSRRGSEHMGLSSEEKRAAMRFTRCFVKGYFVVQSQLACLN
jgi:hypothetical protein